MTAKGQLVLDLPVRPALGREDFLVADCNAEAVAWLDRWPDWPAPALCLYGPAGSGKSHLLGVWRARSEALGVAVDGLRQDAVPALAARGAVALDGADGAGDGVALLHLYNLLREGGGWLLLTGRRPPRQWRLRPPDLESRLLAAPAVAIGPPDDPLLMAVLAKMFADRQVRVGQDVLSYLVPRMERSFAAANRLVAALDGASLSGRRPITVPLARQVLAGAGGA
ncbi:MAG: DnaA/Hda family protein [Alphaproteobacteria bacterium]|jgi:chromosomal replication initiation ATPase DnaA|nr:DnaA/Hda family protein [Alphaproteobacteria bacterium]MDP6564341.1 DnaA/Hda family protein [Alphaproteobacteria bacterium]MDP6815143.1 DnaA/Hda family protein [Alphaproteobacteria bacterium]